MKIVLATHNLDKRTELIPLLDPLGVQLLTLEDFPAIGNIVEDGETFEKNALIKAKAVFSLTGLPALADDTGLEVEALKGAPGVYSARYAGAHCSYTDNVRKLLTEMTNIAPGNRLAKFRTVMAFFNGSLELTTEGTVEGKILEQPKGVGGFGYDPVFYIHKMNKTFAQMTTYEKSKISHRGIAVRKMSELLSHHFPFVHTSESLIKETA